MAGTPSGPTASLQTNLERIPLIDGVDVLVFGMADGASSWESSVKLAANSPNISALSFVATIAVPSSAVKGEKEVVFIFRPTDFATD